MIDRNGYRPNVGIILLNSKNEVFWGKRIKQNSWQFPQGGIKSGESPEQAMYRELTEEIRLRPDQKGMERKLQGAETDLVFVAPDRAR